MAEINGISGMNVMRIMFTLLHYSFVDLHTTRLHPSSRVAQKWDVMITRRQLNGPHRGVIVDNIQYALKIDSHERSK